MRSGQSSIEQRSDTKICVVQRISDGMKECEGDGSQRKSEAVEKECRNSGGQTNMTDLRDFPQQQFKVACCLERCGFTGHVSQSGTHA